MGAARIIAIHHDIVAGGAGNGERLGAGIAARIDMDRLAGGHCRQCTVERRIVGDGNGTPRMRRCGRDGRNRSG